MRSGLGGEGVRQFLLNLLCFLAVTLGCPCSCPYRRTCAQLAHHWPLLSGRSFQFLGSFAYLVLSRELEPPGYRLGRCKALRRTRSSSQRVCAALGKTRHQVTSLPFFGGKASCTLAHPNNDSQCRVSSAGRARMFSWWKTLRSGISNRLPSKSSDGTLNSTLARKPSAEVHRSSELRPKTVHKRNQHLDILGTTEVAAEPTTAPTTNCASAEQSVGEALSRLLDQNWNWVLPEPLPPTQNFEQDVVRVWSANAPPARRQPTAREHAIELFQFLQQQPRLVGKWILTSDLENVVYPHFLACLGWAARPWLGRNGVAKHLGELTVRSCKRVEVGGSTRNWAAFFVSSKTQLRARCREIRVAHPFGPYLLLAINDRRAQFRRFDADLTRPARR